MKWGQKKKTLGNSCSPQTMASSNQDVGAMRNIAIDVLFTIGLV